MTTTGTPSVGKQAGLLGVEDYKDAQQFRSVSEALKLLAIAKNSVDREVEMVSDSLLKEIALNIMDSHLVKVDEIQTKLKQKLQPAIEKQSAVVWIYSKFEKHFVNSFEIVKSKNPLFAEQVVDDMIKEFDESFKETDRFRDYLEKSLLSLRRENRSATR